MATIIFVKMICMGILIKNTRIINRGHSTYGDILIKDRKIEKTGGVIEVQEKVQEIDGEGLWCMPGIIDDQVHFREPGYTHKAEIATESRAALAGGVTSYMEMPNTFPPAVTGELLEDKYRIASRNSYANYSFFMGVSNDNYDELMRADPQKVCGYKIFMGSSTGNLLVDNREVLDKIFASVPMLIATHCEDENTVRARTELFKNQYGSDAPASIHPLIRNTEACLLSSSFAVDLARKHGTRLHVLHLTTADELGLFNENIPLKEKKITAEVCVHHLYFCDQDYEALGNRIKCNPAIKTAADRDALLKGLLSGKLDIIATDHAPHTAEEKSRPYFEAPAGLPLVQHSLNIMMDFHHRNLITMEQVVEKMCHAPADCFRVKDRGYLDEGHYADIVLIDPDRQWTVSTDNILYKCGWSPFEGKKFRGKVDTVLLNGTVAYHSGHTAKTDAPMRLEFDR